MKQPQRPKSPGAPRLPKTFTLSPKAIAALAALVPEYGDNASAVVEALILAAAES